MGHMSKIVSKYLQYLDNSNYTYSGNSFWGAKINSICPLPRLPIARFFAKLSNKASPNFNCKPNTTDFTTYATISALFWFLGLPRSRSSRSLWGMVCTPALLPGHIYTFTPMCYVASKRKNTTEAVFLKTFCLKTPDAKIQAEMTPVSVRTCPSKFTWSELSLLFVFFFFFLLMQWTTTAQKQNCSHWRWEAAVRYLHSAQLLKVCSKEFVTRY